MGCYNSAYSISTAAIAATPPALTCQKPILSTTYFTHRFPKLASRVRSRNTGKGQNLISNKCDAAKLPMGNF